MAIDRRALLASIAATILASHRSATAQTSTIPLWRGFNLVELVGGERNRNFVESDFRWMAEWGFNFARLPCSYWSWSSPNDWMKIDARALKPLDRGIEFGRQNKIHINLCLHRIPGYCVNGREREPFQLFNSPPEQMRVALEAAVFHWKTLAERYRDVPSAELSFDLINEPPFMSDQSRYVEIAKTLISTIRDISPDRLIFVDGADLGQTPVMQLTDQRIVQSTRGYLPKMVSHYGASWVPPNEFESRDKPAWPMIDQTGARWDRDRLRHELIDKWSPLLASKTPVHVGEWGCLNKTPHETCLAWMKDVLSLWKDAGWGWCLWNFRGPFGILDSGRSDVRFEWFRGHFLDRKILELLIAN